MKKKPLKIAVLFSGSASSARHMKTTDTNCGKEYEFTFALSNKKDASGIQFFKDNNIVCEMLNTKNFCIENGYDGKIKDMPHWLRRDYFTKVVELLKPFNVDLILLSGFMLEITTPLLGYLPILNVHPADLRIKETIKRPRHGRYNPLVGVEVPKYTGDNAVALAIKHGETETRSTIHLVEERVDEGRIICVSEPLVVDPRISVKEHQEKMKTMCDGPAYIEALRQIYTGEFVLN